MKNKFNFLSGITLVLALLSSCATNEHFKSNNNEEINVAINYIDKGEYDAAFNILSKIEARDKNNFYAIYNLAVIYHSWGRFAEARSKYQKALTILDHPEFATGTGMRYRRIIESNMAVLGYNN